MELVIEDEEDEAVVGEEESEEVMEMQDSSASNEVKIWFSITMPSSSLLSLLMFHYHFLLSAETERGDSRSVCHRYCGCYQSGVLFSWYSVLVLLLLCLENFSEWSLVIV